MNNKYPIVIYSRIISNILLFSFLGVFSYISYHLITLKSHEFTNNVSNEAIMLNKDFSTSIEHYSYILKEKIKPTLEYEIFNKGMINYDSKQKNLNDKYEVTNLDLLLGSLKNNLPTSSNITVLILVDKDYNILASSGFFEQITKYTNLKDRGYLKLAKEYKNKVMYDEFIKGKLSRSWILPLAITLNSPKGTVEGYIVIAVKFPSLSSYLINSMSFTNLSNIEFTPYKNDYKSLTDLEAVHNNPHAFFMKYVLLNDKDKVYIRVPINHLHKTAIFTYDKVTLAKEYWESLFQSIVILIVLGGIFLAAYRLYSSKVLLPITELYTEFKEIQKRYSSVIDKNKENESTNIPFSGLPSLSKIGGNLINELESYQSIIGTKNKQMKELVQHNASAIELIYSEAKLIREALNDLVTSAQGIKDLAKNKPIIEFINNLADEALNNIVLIERYGVFLEKGLQLSINDKGTVRVKVKDVLALVKQDREESIVIDYQNIDDAEKHICIYLEPMRLAIVKAIDYMENFKNFEDKLKVRSYFSAEGLFIIEITISNVNNFESFGRHLLDEAKMYVLLNKGMIASQTNDNSHSLFLAFGGVVVNE